MKGKLVTIEGTDCSGKQTQTNLLIQRFVYMRDQLIM